MSFRKEMNLETAVAEDGRSTQDKWLLPNYTVEFSSDLSKCRISKHIRYNGIDDDGNERMQTETVVVENTAATTNEMTVAYETDDQNLFIVFRNTGRDKQEWDIKIFQSDLAENKKFRMRLVPKFEYKDVHGLRPFVQAKHQGKEVQYVSWLYDSNLEGFLDDVVPEEEIKKIKETSKSTKKAKSRWATGSKVFFNLMRVTATATSFAARLYPDNDYIIYAAIGAGVASVAGEPIVNAVATATSWVYTKTQFAWGKLFSSKTKQSVRYWLYVDARNKRGLIRNLMPIMTRGEWQFALGSNCAVLCWNRPGNGDLPELKQFRFSNQVKERLFEQTIVQGGQFDWVMADNTFGHLFCVQKYALFVSVGFDAGNKTVSIRQPIKLDIGQDERLIASAAFINGNSSSTILFVARQASETSRRVVIETYEVVFIKGKTPEVTCKLLENPPQVVVYLQTPKHQIKVYRRAKRNDTDNPEFMVCELDPKGKKITRRLINSL